MADKGFERGVDEAGNLVLVKTMPGGGKVVKPHRGRGSSSRPVCYDAYDAGGHYLGNTNSLTDAERAADRGFVILLNDACSDLSLWVLWNDAVNSGVHVYQTESGSQILALDSNRCPSSHYLIVSEAEDGWDVDLLDINELDMQYGDGDYGLYRLTVAETPFVLE